MSVFLVSEDDARSRLLFTIWNQSVHLGTVLAIIRFKMPSSSAVFFLKGQLSNICAFQFFWQGNSKSWFWQRSTTSIDNISIFINVRYTIIAIFATHIDGDVGRRNRDCFFSVDCFTYIIIRINSRFIVSTVNRSSVHEFTIFVNVCTSEFFGDIEGNTSARWNRTGVSSIIFILCYSCTRRNKRCTFVRYNEINCFFGITSNSDGIQ